MGINRQLVSSKLYQAVEGEPPRIFAVVNAILYVLCQGCTWRALPSDSPAWSTVYGYFCRWSKDGTWLKVQGHSVSVGSSSSFEESLVPGEAAVDSQSVETATMISIDVGYDAGKHIHGRKRHLSVDLRSLVLRVLVTSASVGERTGAKLVLTRVHGMGNTVKRLHTIWMDGGYRGENFIYWVMDMFRSIVEIVLRPLEKKGFVLLPKRWVVERTFGWLNWCRRLELAIIKDYQKLHRLLFTLQ